MAIHTIDDDILNSDAAADYFTRADYRVMMGFRATLELLNLPVPVYAIRKKPGRTPARDVAAAYAADHPTPRPMTLAPRKPNASPERIASLVAAARNGRGGA
jgi:hypothetical protein